MHLDPLPRWQACPALLVAGALALGVVAADQTPGAGTGMGVLVLANAAALTARLLARRRLVTPAPLIGTLALLVGAVGLGGMLHAAQQVLPPDHVAHRLHAQGPVPAVLLEGRVRDDPATTHGRTRFTLDLERLVDGDTVNASGAVLVSLYTPRYDTSAIRTYPPLRQGDMVQVRGHLRLPDGRRNPADFDYARYLRRRGLYVLLGVDEPAAVVVQGHRRGPVERVITPVRAHVRAQLAQFVPGEAARGVAEALLLGDRSGLDPPTREHFARTGLMHLLAVSGLHVLLVGMVLYRLLGPLLSRLGLDRPARELTRSALTMAVLVVYLFTTGASASVMRAVVMAGVFLGGAVLQRTAHPLNALGAAAVILLLVDPGRLFDVGFQLSFSAVGAIVLLYRPAFDRLPAAWTAPGLPGYVTASVLVSLAATLGTLPVLLYHFGRASFGGLLLNLIAIPLTGMTLAAGLVTVLLGGWASWLAGVFGAAAGFTAEGLLRTARYGDAWFSWLLVDRYVHGGWLVASMTALLVMLAVWARPRLRWRTGGVALACATVSVWLGVAGGAHTPRLEVVFFDVGHGDAALLRLPGDRHLLIDAGARNAYTDQGTRTLLPHLRRYGIRRLDAVVISHPHSDHLGGLPSLLRAVDVRQVIHNGQPYESELFATTQRLLDSLGVPHRAVIAGDTLALDPSVRIQVISPLAPPSADAANEGSVVLRLVYQDVRLLFLGDAAAGAEHAMTRHYPDLLAADVVKVGHHGSRTSSTPSFVHLVRPDTTRPGTAVVSVARSSPFGLPDEEVLRRWAARGAWVWTTAGDGALWLQSDGYTFEPVRW